MPRRPKPNSLWLTLMTHARSRYAGNSFCLRADKRGRAVAFHGRWSVGAIQIQLEVKLEELAVFGALCELEDSGLLRRGRTCDQGRASMVAYWLCPPPANLSAKARLPSSFIRKQTEPAPEQRSLKTKGLAFDSEVWSSRGLVLHKASRDPGNSLVRTRGCHAASEED